MNRTGNSSLKGSRRRKKFTLPNRMVQAVSSYISEQTYDSGNANELRVRLEKIVKNDEFWDGIEELEMVSKRLDKFMQHYN